MAGTVDAINNGGDILSGAFNGMVQGAIAGAKSGAISGGISGGINFLAGDAINSISSFSGNNLSFGNSTASQLITDGTRNALYTMGSSIVQGRHMSSENAWADFTSGFSNGALQSGMEMLYKNQTGFKPDPAPGKGYSGDGNVRLRKNGESFVGKSENSIGIPIKKGKINSIFPEGGTLSNLLNKIPGQNAHSKLHDVWSKNWMLAIGVTPASIYVTYQGLRNGMF